MSERIITLFGEEIVPEQLKAVGRSRAKKKSDDKKEDEGGTTEATAATDSELQTEQVQDNDKNEAISTASHNVAVQHPVDLNNNGKQPAPPQAEQPPAGEEQSDDEPAEAPAGLPDDWKGSKQYYSIGEVAELFKVKTSNIRFWTIEFKLKVRTTRKGDRLYTPEQIKELKTIYHLVKQGGFTIAGAKTKLAAPNNMEVQTVDLKQSLLQLRNKLTAIKNQLK